MGVVCAAKPPLLHSFVDARRAATRPPRAAHSLVLSRATAAAQSTALQAQDALSGITAERDNAAYGAELCLCWRRVARRPRAAAAATALFL